MSVSAVILEFFIRCYSYVFCDDLAIFCIVFYVIGANFTSSLRNFMISMLWRLSMLQIVLL